MSLTVDDLPRRAERSGEVAASGVLDIEIRPTGLVAWQVDQVTIDMPTAPFGATARLLVNDRLVTPMIAAADAAGGDPPLPLFSGDTMTVRWEGATPGDQGRVLMIYRQAGYRR